MQKPDPEKHHAILAAARKRFYRYGIKKTNMQEIAKDVGLAVGTLYRYFKDKEAIVLACTETFAERHRQEAQQILDSRLLPAKKLKHYLTVRFKAAQETRQGEGHAAEIARAVIRLNPERLQDETTIMIETITAILQSGIERGAFNISDLNRNVDVFLYAIAYFFPIAGREPFQEPTEEALLKVLDWFLEQWSKKESVL